MINVLFLMKKEKKLKRIARNFTRDSYVKIGLVDTTIINDQKVQYEDEEMGKITCTGSMSMAPEINNRFQRTL